MTAAELIAKLNEVPPQCVVVVDGQEVDYIVWTDGSDEVSLG